MKLCVMASDLVLFATCMAHARTAVTNPHQEIPDAVTADGKHSMSTSGNRLPKLEQTVLYHPGPSRRQ